MALSYDSIASVFSAFGELKGVFAADDNGAHDIVSHHDESSATAALEAFDGHPSLDLGGYSLHVRYSVLQSASQIVGCATRDDLLQAAEWMQHRGYHRTLQVLNVLHAAEWMQLVEQDRVRHAAYLLAMEKQEGFSGISRVVVRWARGGGQEIVPSVNCLGRLEPVWERVIICLTCCRARCDEASLGGDELEDGMGPRIDEDGTV
ncbi:alkylated DNA repair protein ALKBH8 homolog [Carya illinoinensis]|uniref:alkylated DNA repair protein ALKBH8 homolog n=1 Tax=Carya illinoinensis TaxID=32201 RepID=UPI001C722933|nr:alkylated DNA repair protein ALKBH8 homolog [Carya illinoinensis]